MGPGIILAVFFGAGHLCALPTEIVLRSGTIPGMIAGEILPQMPERNDSVG